MIVTLWWLGFFTAFGLCIGSFLNVVVFRLPRGLELSKPTWSFCPQCRTRIAWYDNLPVVGYFRLGGRCRDCGLPISVRYPVVELLTAIIVLLLLDTFFIGQWREGLGGGYDLNNRLVSDWPVFLAHVILFMCLAAMSAIDLEHYWIDIRFTHFAAAAGFVLFAIWTPAHSVGWVRPFDVTSVVCLAVFVTFVLTLLVLDWRIPVADDPLGAPDASDGDATDVVEDSHWPVVPPLVVLGFVLVTSAMSDGGDDAGVWPVIRVVVPLVLLVGVVLRGAATVRASDTEIIEAIEEEAPDARRQTLMELVTLLPAIGVGVGVFCLMRSSFSTSVVDMLHWNPVGEWQPLWGLGTAVSGYVIAAGIGWLVRILSNLGFGREAFATGDIHMMAAAGAVVGWPVVLLGFVVSCVLASAGWVVVLPFKQTRAIPLGPWLLLGFLTATVFYQPLVESTVIQNLLFVVDHVILQNPQESVAVLSAGLLS